MEITPPSIARRIAKRARDFQEGTILSYTTVTHPPAGFDSSPRTIGLVELADSRRVLAPLIVPVGTKLQIGAKLLPRMRLSRVNADGLRHYDVAFEIVTRVPVEEREPFHGYILAFTGPSGVGKTTVRRLLVHMFQELLAEVPILTTRGPKEGDDGEYRYIDPGAFLRLREKGEVVATTHIPSSTEERWYGYRKEDIKTIWAAHKIPVVITEMQLLQDLAAHYGRRAILSFGLLPPGRSKRSMLSALLHRLRARGRDAEEHIADRVKNAEKDLAFFRERRDLFDHLLVNDNLEGLVVTLRKYIPGLSEA